VTLHFAACHLFTVFWSFHHWLILWRPSRSCERCPFCTLQ
jgi:hypothetical protein